MDGRIKSGRDSKKTHIATSSKSHEDRQRTEGKWHIKRTNTLKVMMPDKPDKVGKKQEYEKQDNRYLEFST